MKKPDISMTRGSSRFISCPTIGALTNIATPDTNMVSPTISAL